LTITDRHKGVRLKKGLQMTVTDRHGTKTEKPLYLTVTDRHSHSRKSAFFSRKPRIRAPSLNFFFSYPLHFLGQKNGVCKAPQFQKATQSERGISEQAAIRSTSENNPLHYTATKNRDCCAFFEKSCVYLQIPQTAGRSNPSVRIKNAHPNGQASEPDRQKNFYRKLLSEARTPLFSLCRYKFLTGQRFRAANRPGKLFCKTNTDQNFCEILRGPRRR
jgi:hypothetical protein